MIRTESVTFASLAMYPFDPLREAWEALYSAAAAHVGAAPSTLRWDLDPHDSWLDPQLVLGMACGWPLVTALRDRVRPVGAFAYDLDGGVSHLCRSVIVTDRDRPLAHEPTIAAINSADSLSGHISLLAAVNLDDRSWSGPIVRTGSHVASIEAVRCGHADVASIDALTWAYLERDSPRELDGLTIVGRGPTVPSLPVIARNSTTDALVTAWRNAIGSAIADPKMSGVCDTLMIRGFVALDLDDYADALADLVARFGTE